MSATLTQLRAQVRENLAQPSAPTNGKWSDTHINQKITNRIRRLNRYFKVGTIDTSITTTTNTFEYDFPTDIVEIDKIELWDLSDSDNYFTRGEILNWKTINDAGTLKIIFPDALGYDSTTASRYTLKIFGKKRLTEPAADDTSVDCQLEEEELIVLGSTIDCLRDLYRNRIDMTRYLANAQRQSGSTIDISRAISDYKQEYYEIWKDLRKNKVQKLSYES